MKEGEHVALRKAGLFCLTTFGASWTLAGVFGALGGNARHGAATFVYLAYMFIPMLSAILVQKVFYREAVAGPLRISFRPRRAFLAAWLIPPAIALAAYGVGLLMPGVAYAPNMEGMTARFAASLSETEARELVAQLQGLPVPPLLLALLQGLVAGATINAVAAFGEELGWRGFLLRELGFLGFWRGALAIGLIWGIWHAPIILQGHNYPDHPVAGVLVMTAFCVLYAPLLAYVAVKARSVVAAAVMHGTLNGTFGLAIMRLQGGNDLTVGVTGLAGLIVLAAAGVVLWAYDRRWARTPVGSDPFFTRSAGEGSV